ncbi:oxysterol-binding protein 1 isoform X2 [Lingula anatina]|uniref:Oxysterol-binding protein n=1 Tax=Lingula anatina TaxID=7574 RepID=A0A2R2MKW8_LINAN|nr:oxysterol-binding protein 1 isoform X2 [Lingula anatina]|eukprot:XP_023930845.1 oxysterol-binding protein 1 isoform X2 [Lingula anatina]
MTDSKTMPSSDSYKGWLYKWTNYIKGYQKRWFVLQNGLLSYYRNQAEMAHTCRGTINLANAFIHTEDSCSFVISNGGTQTYHLKASSEVERQKWVTALELAKAKAIRMMESGISEDGDYVVFNFYKEKTDSEEDEDLISQPDKDELQNTLRTLGAKLEDLNTCNDLIVKHGAALQKSLSELEQLDNSTDTATRIKSVNERATLFRITSSAMINACSDFLDLAQTQGKRWQRLLQHEHEQRVRLEDMVEQIAKQQQNLEKQARKSLAAANLHSKIDTNDTEPKEGSEEEEDDFFDALDIQHTEYQVALPHKPSMHKGLRRVGSDVSQISLDSLGAGYQRQDYDSSESDAEGDNEARVIATARKQSKTKMGQPGTPVRTRRANSLRKRRSAILERPNHTLNLWGIMKNCIGRDLSKIPMPVNFSEPLSMLQRLTEEFEYSEILDTAAACEDSCEQLAYVAAFTISAYATTSFRTGKPFNPLLGETYECDRRDDYGWRVISEQVSHHPPTAAMYAEGRDWALWQEFTMSSKFRGKYLAITPLGIAHLRFNKSGNHYTWRKVTTTVHNIIVGKLWVDNHGEMDIVNHTNGDLCHLKYSQYSYFSRETPRKVTGVVADRNGQTNWVLTGMWDEKIEGAKVLSCTTSSKGKPVFESGPSKVLWKKNPIPPGNEKMYNFTQLAVELNEMEPGVAPTDSRLRPDQRSMENQDWDGANKEKLKLEEKQRLARKRREAEAEQAASEGREYVPYEPAWFKKTKDQQTGNLIHMYTHEYWEAKEKQDWGRCLDIYL